jgi:drug/metabolite transporter (DMT)-like permease
LDHLNGSLFGFTKDGALIAIIAQGLIGISLVWDKVLLRHPGTRNLFSYVFWLGAMSALGVLLLPFGYRSPSFTVIWIAFVAGVVHLTGVFFYYAALKRGEASGTLAIMGGFSPVATAVIALPLIGNRLQGEQLIGFGLMTAGSFAMFFSERLPLRAMLPPVLLASGLLGLVNVLEKVVYDQTNFVSGYVWFTLGTFSGALALLLHPSWRKQILSEREKDEPRNRFWYFVNRFVSGVGSFLIFYAISLTNPAIVDAIAGVRFAVIFIGAYLLTKLKSEWLTEDFRGLELYGKIAATLLVIAGLVLTAMSGGNGTGSGGTTALANPRTEITANACLSTASRR